MSECTNPGPWCCACREDGVCRDTLEKKEWFDIPPTQDVYDQVEQDYRRLEDGW